MYRRLGAECGSSPSAGLSRHFAGGQRIGQALANRYREDLQHARIGSGRHGFAFAPPDGLPLVPMPWRFGARWTPQRSSFLTVRGGPSANAAK
jgi:hypothetical protein